MPLFKRFLAVSLLVAQASAALAQGSGAVDWHTDLDAARALAEKEQKLLIVHFYTDNCGPCRVLDATVFNQPTVAAALREHYVPVKLDASEYQATAERFGISRVPTDVVITPEGQVVKRTVSPATPMAYISHVTNVAQQYQREVSRSIQTASPNRGTSEPVNSAYATLPVPADSNSFTSTAGQTPAGVTGNLFAHSGAANAPGAGAATPRYPNPAAPVETPSAQPASSPVAVANPYANQPVTPMADQEAQASPGGGLATTASPETAAGPQLPPGSPPLGFFGYCPVTMKKENRWQQGDTRWGCYHRGRTYLFASQEKRDEFLAAGDDYAPALSGADPVLAIDKNRIEPGKQEFGIEYDGRFYLFSSEDNLRKFWSQAERYATGVRQAMNATPDALKYR